MNLRTLFLTFLLIPALASAAPEPFPDSRSGESSTSDVHRYRLVLSELKRTQAETSGETELRLKGSLTRNVYELPDGASLIEVTEHYRRQLAGERLLYSCIGIDCGSSNFWANDVFGNARLVSRDKEQSYLVTAGTAQGQNQLHVVYVTMRGGRQPKVLVDELLTSDSLMPDNVTVAQVSAALAETSGWLPGLVTRDGELDIEASRAMVSAVQALAVGVRNRLHLMVHCYDGVRMEDTIDCSEVIAVALREQLPDVDIRAQGALIPPPDSERKPAVRFVFWPGR